ncbi:PD40 domain-containing protein [Streptomyces ferrugineus]|uniref:PD40 domain-containing protein n=1 Tax=Streptomyces ferrugineus TaxID=1413221 RepID=A0A7M2SGD8_9ACTN|nr:PD40 domain-containing protein [Streptomyces ferrugineus]QOV35342.1 PD40 domain-containing protein [Streptomyces ferrugineus]
MRGISVAVLAGTMIAASATAASPAPEPVTERVTLTAAGDQGDGDSYGPRFSAGGRFAAFTSYATNLVPGDTNGYADVFVRDLRKGTVERVSVASDGTQADHPSSAAAISADGRYVLFRSTARNLVPWDPPPTNDAAEDVYLHDRRTGGTERISVAFDGGSAFAAGAHMSADARHIVFNAKADRMESGARDLFGAVYAYDRRTGSTERISNGDRPANPALLDDISADGRYVAYTQLVPRSGDGVTWVHDRRTGTEEQVNVKADGTPAQRYAMPVSLSADGRTVAFKYTGDDLVPSDGSDLYIRDLRANATRRIAPGPDGERLLDSPLLSPDGRHLAYEAQPRQADGQYGPDNVYLRDLRTGATRLISTSVTGGPVTDEYVTVYEVSAGAGRIGLGSRSAQLVPDDTNGHHDGFVHRRR